MSENEKEPEAINDQEALKRLAYLTENYVPDATWTVGGAFRFDRSLKLLGGYMSNHLGVRRVDNVMGAPPCLWTLDWFVQRRPIAFERYSALLQDYAKMNIGVHLVFDNPFLTEEDLEDPYGMMLVQELLKNNQNHRNAISVASDRLRDKILSVVPGAPILCHMNRLVAEPGRRTADLYNRLAAKYARVGLHPADAVKPSILDGIKEPERFDVVVNDSCLRTCPVRKDHLRLLAAMRKNAYDVNLMQQRANLIARTECQKQDAAALHQKVSCNLTHDEMRAIFNRGMRHYLIQDSQFRNEMTLLWDVFQCMLDRSPDISNKAAVIATSAMAEFGRAKDQLPSGLTDFSFTNYE